jgi:glycopeptide antibiotics resistance protein
MKININFIIILSSILMVVLPTIILFAFKKHKKALKITAVIFAVVYFILLFIGTTFKFKVKGDFVFINADFSYDWFSMRFLPYSFSRRNIIINLAMFFPIGFLVYIFSKKHRFLKTIIFAFLLSLFVEFYQFALPVSRTTELTDVLFNTLSGIISSIYCYFLTKLGFFIEN